MKNTIRVERARFRVTQKQLGKKVGVSRQTIHSIETGKFNPGLILSMKIARLFRLEVEDVFELNEKE